MCFPGDDGGGTWVELDYSLSVFGAPTMSGAAKCLRYFLFFSRPREAACGILHMSGKCNVKDIGGFRDQSFSHELLDARGIHV